MNEIVLKSFDSTLKKRKSLNTTIKVYICNAKSRIMVKKDSDELVFKSAGIGGRFYQQLLMYSLWGYLKWFFTDCYEAHVRGLKTKKRLVICNPTVLNISICNAKEIKVEKMFAKFANIGYFFVLLHRKYRCNANCLSKRISEWIVLFW